MLISFLLFSCTENKSDLRGTKYTINKNPFSSTYDIELSSDYAPIDFYIIVLDEILSGNNNKGMKIKISDDNIKEISKEDVDYIYKNGSKIYADDNMLSALGKAQIVLDRLK